ncbi:lysin motif [Trichococcus palustris]|jgi:peptidoglycan-N-acetylglucosamine deacetylase|uniref:Lysin motif n=1 Tax=Trichococcus palustris TaxID=140314 RepID=A0A143YGA0_9LACT|nr:LysM peptidoglycan-binding domain-containing protein [Trichococcus palustris]CZQ87867.1 lysin motif [Trichococcus palustris]SFK77640.1 polysaccharide deacetylase family sporulation protein PdaB [Trichococcus palustris]
MSTHSKVFRNISGLIFSFFLLFAFTAPSALAATSQIIYQGSTTNKVVALTFDDGSDGYNIQSILNVLSANNVKATFFLTGQGAENHPQAIKNIVAAGHDIGNHSYDHPDFTTISTAEMTNQINRTETIISNLTGKSTKPYFRAPYGAYNSTVLQTVGDAGYAYTLQWTIDSLDWTGNSSTDIYNRVINNIVPGAIILMHAGYGANGTSSALPNIISQLRAMGYSFVTISQLRNMASVPGSGTGASYTVQAGDTLYGIALRYGVTVQQLVSANNLTDANLIRVGQVLTIPGTGTTPTPTPTPSTGTTYTVKSGDTLYGIALQYGVTVQQIVSANNIANANLIRVGQVLTIPGAGTTPTPTPTPTPSTGTTYTVKSGDTLYAIALRYGVTIQQIVSANNIANANLISVGQVLTIPGAGTTPTPTPTTGTTYTVKAGDTLYAIALRYGITIQQIVSANNISNPNLISIGQVLKIPQ